MKIDFKTILVLLFLGFVWGSAFMLMKRGLESFNALQVASLRLVFAGLIAVFFFFKFYKTIVPKDWKFLALSGTIGNLIPAYLFASAGAEMPSSLSGALNALTPFFALLAGVFLFSQLFKIRQAIGISIGLVGALALILSKSKTGISFETAY
ncbi:MAG: DMT family transporter, partial [Bacteroidia bacterium]|nr:DMT family transporter [Bacteroidia bacterium]